MTKYFVVSKMYRPGEELFKQFDSKQEALDYEIYYISSLKIKGQKLYNLTNGGDGASGYRHTEKAKKIFSAQRKGR